MLAETRPSHPTMMSAVRHVAGLLGMSPETLRLWQRRILARPRREWPDALFAANGLVALGLLQSLVVDGRMLVPLTSRSSGSTTSPLLQPRPCRSRRSVSRAG